MSELTRERQRELEVLKMSTDASRKAGSSTLIDTIHCDADTIEWLYIKKGQTFRDYTPKERRRMASEGRALPDGSFPIANCTDAANAIRAVGRAKNPGTARAFIKRRVRALSCSGAIFDDWK